jgi:hypothetical protein
MEGNHIGEVFVAASTKGHPAPHQASLLLSFSYRVFRFSELHL